MPGNADVGWLFLPVQPEHIAALFLTPIGEEIGWRGYALLRLLARHGAYVATAIVGVLWAAWHVPMFIGSGDPGWSSASSSG